MFTFILYAAYGQTGSGKTYTMGFEDNVSTKNLLCFKQYYKYGNSVIILVFV